jgi:uncharacterized YccA/Bax inhibitor family protein
VWCYKHCHGKTLKEFGALLLLSVCGFIGGHLLLRDLANIYAVFFLIDVANAIFLKRFGPCGIFMICVVINVAIVMLLTDFVPNRQYLRLYIYNFRFDFTLDGKYTSHEIIK